jgi:hypothetical protein
MVKSMAGFSKNPAILFAMFCRVYESDPAGVDMAPCCNFLQESPPSTLRVESVKTTPVPASSTQEKSAPKNCHSILFFIHRDSYKIHGMCAPAPAPPPPPPDQCGLVDKKEGSRIRREGTARHKSLYNAAGTNRGGTSKITQNNVCPNSI